jgi:SulP family sulfate permease
MNCPANQLEYMTLSEGETWVTLLYIAMTMSIIHFLPKVNNKYVKLLPSAMIAIIIGTILEQLVNRPYLKMDTRTVAETANISGDFPTIHIPQLPPNPDWPVII